MKHLGIFISFLLLVSNISFSQSQNAHPVTYIFNADADAQKDLDDAIAKAGVEHKYVLAVVGGDWSYWSKQLDYRISKGKNLPDAMANYIFVRINFSPENKNSDLLGRLGCPKDMGYPLIVILDGAGKPVHIQNTDQFKADKMYYNLGKLSDSLIHWSAPTAAKKH